MNRSAQILNVLIVITEAHLDAVAFNQRMIEIAGKVRQSAIIDTFSRQNVVTAVITFKNPRKLRLKYTLSQYFKTSAARRCFIDNGSAILIALSNNAAVFLL